MIILPGDFYIGAVEKVTYCPLPPKGSLINILNINKSPSSPSRSRFGGER